MTVWVINKYPNVKDLGASASRNECMPAERIQKGILTEIELGMGEERSGSIVEATWQPEQRFRAEIKGGRA